MAKDVIKNIDCFHSGDTYSLPSNGISIAVMAGAAGDRLDPSLFLPKTIPDNLSVDYSNLSVAWIRKEGVAADLTGTVVAIAKSGNIIMPRISPTTGLTGRGNYFVALSGRISFI